MAKGGILHVTLVSATLLPRSSAQDSADSYATLICGKQQFTTRTAKDQGTLPTWNETHVFEVEDRDEFGSHELVIEIYAARPEQSEVLGVVKLPVYKVIPANEETSLYPLSRPHEGECGQVKVTLKWASNTATTTTQSASMYSGYEQIQPTEPIYRPASEQPSAHVHPNKDPGESYYGEQLCGDASTPADAAASALAGLALSKERQRSSESSQTAFQGGTVSASNFAHHDVEVQSPYAAYPPSPEKTQSNPHQRPEIDTYSVSVSDSYPSYSTETPGHYTSHLLPYLASPIGGVVTTGPDYDSPTSAYTHPPFEITSKLKESESDSQRYGLPANAYPESSHHCPPSLATYPPADLDQADKKTEKVSNMPFGTPFYLGVPSSQPGSYPPAFQSHDPRTGNHSYPAFAQYGAASSPSSENYPPAASSYPPNADFGNKGQMIAHEHAGASAHYGSAPYAGVNAPKSNVGYPRNSPLPYSSQYDPSTPSSAVYTDQEITKEGKDKKKISMNSSGQSTGEGKTQEKGFHGYQHAYPIEGYAQPYYPFVPYPQHGYPLQNLPHGYPPPAYPPQHAPQHIAPGFGGLYPQYGHQAAYGVAPPYQGHHQHGQYHHHGGHGGHKFEGHKGGHGYGHQGYGGHKNGHGYYGHKGSHGYGGYDNGRYTHHDGRHSHNKHHKF